MADPAFVAAGLATSSTTTTAVTITKPAGTVSGHTLWAGIVNAGAGTEPTTPASGWTLVDSTSFETGAAWAGVYKLVAGGSEPANYTWDGGTDSLTGAMIAISDADTTTPIDVQAEATGDSTTPGTAGVTTTADNRLLVAMAMVGDNVAFSAWVATDPTTLTERADQQNTGGNDSAAGIAADVKTTAGATGANQATLAGSRPWAAWLFAIKGAAGGTDATVNASVIAAPAVVPAPALSTGSVVTAVTVASAAAVPTVSITAETVVSPATVAALGAVPVPALATGSVVSAVSIASVAAVPAPTVSTGSTVATSTIAAVASVPAPDVASAAVVDVVTVASSATVPAPTISTGSTVTASTVAGVSAVPAPTVSTGSTVTASVVAAVAAVPAPEVSTEAGNVSAVTVVGTASVPAPTISTGSTVAATTVSATAGVPAVQVSTATNVDISATTVASVGAVPAPGISTGVTVVMSVISAVTTVPLAVAAGDEEPLAVVSPSSGGWYSLLAIKREWQEIAQQAEQERMHPVACPHDGEPLRTGPRGELYCIWGDYTLA